MSNIIFIGGIHGVGKGTICTKIATLYGFEHITASEVLKWNEISDIDNKLVSNLKYTQDKLITNLNSLVHPLNNYILDGHYCLLNSENKSEKINESTFMAINPKAFVIITDEVNQIKLRLEKRDHKIYNIDMLADFQNMEVDYAKELAIKLNKSLIQIQHNNLNQLTTFLQHENTT